MARPRSASGRKTVQMLAPEGHQLFEVLFEGRHVGAISPPDDGIPFLVKPLGAVRHRHEIASGEARRNAYGETLLCRNGGHPIPPDALYTVETEEPVCQACRPFTVVRPLP